MDDTRFVRFLEKQHLTPKIPFFERNNVDLHPAEELRGNYYEVPDQWSGKRKFEVAAGESYCTD